MEEFDFLTVGGRDSAFVSLGPDDILFAKGEPADTMYIVRSGLLEIYDGLIILEVVGKGGILGEMAVIDGDPRSASARALTAAEVIPVDAANFHQMVAESPAFALQVMRVMGRRLRTMNDRMQPIPT